MINRSVVVVVVIVAAVVVVPSTRTVISRFDMCHYSYRLIKGRR
jgi:hypothetical protein